MRHKPFPHLIIPRKWKITDIGNTINGATNTVTGEFLVPSADGHLYSLIRNHEMAHLAFTPDSLFESLKHVDLIARNYAEDCRITMLSARKHVAVNLCESGCKECNDYLASHINDMRGHLRLTGHPNPDVAEEICEIRCNRYNGKIVELLDQYDLDPQFTYHLAHYLHSLLHPTQGNGKGEQGNQASKDAQNAYGVKPTRTLHSSWGKVNPLLTPELTRAHRIPRRLRNRETGIQLGDVSRLLTDRRVFRDIASSKTGTLLLDASGSMDIEAIDILKLLDRWPAGKVAIYGGRDYKGSIAIVANKRRAIDAHRLEALRAQVGKNNLIDGPALDWLSTQPEPRIWVSDGGVNGVHGQDDQLHRECDRIMREGSIVRYHSIDLLLSERSPKRLTHADHTSGDM